MNIKGIKIFVKCITGTKGACKDNYYELIERVRHDGKDYLIIEGDGYPEIVLAEFFKLN